MTQGGSWEDKSASQAKPLKINSDPAKVRKKDDDEGKVREKQKKSSQFF